MCKEFLNIINCYCFVNGSSCTSFFTTLVADMSANCREWILFLNKSKSILVLALCSKL